MDRRLHLSLDEPTRRAFLARAAGGLLGVTALPALPRGGLSTGGTARSVIYLFMRGGMSHLDTFDPKPGAATQGPVEAIPTVADGVLVSQHFPLLARQMDKVAIVSSMKSTQGAHSQGQYFMHTSYELRGTIAHPGLGAWIERLGGKGNPTLPSSVLVGGAGGIPGAGFLPPGHTPLPIGDPDAGLQHSARADGVDEPTFARRLRRLRQLDAAFAERYGGPDVEAYHETYDAAVRLMNSADLAAFDLGEEPEAIRAAYGSSKLARGCLLARRLVERGVRFVEVTSDGWDTHDQNFDRLEERCPDLDRGLAALLADLHSRGLLEETLVVVATEFGRTPDIVAERLGRNHYPQAFSCLLAGGGVRGGRRFGRTDGEGREVVESPVSVPDFNATIAWALGLPLDEIVTSPSGRPFTVADKGKPVTELFA